MKQLVSINLTTRTAKDWAPPELTFGESLTLALRFYKNTEGAEIDAELEVSSLKASIGRVDARPSGGMFSVKIGTDPDAPTNTSALVENNVQAAKLAAALNATEACATYGTASVAATNGSWIITFGDQADQVPLSVVNNSLSPVSYGRVYAWQVDGKWVHELRLTQAPVAFTSSHETSLPPSPEITRIQAGGSDPSATYFWNEIQQLYVPAEFRGTYILKKGYAKTAQLSRDDDASAIQDALQALGADCFNVTLPLSNKPTIEFVGDYSGITEDLLGVEVEQAPAPDIAFTVTLDRAELAVMLRSEESVTLPLEIRINGTDDSGFSGEICAMSLDVVIRRPVIFPELEEVPALNLLRPYSPKTYIPFGAANVLTGQHYYPATVGDGEAASFVIAHGLDSEAVFVFARLNVSGGRQLIDGTDFSVTIDNANQVTVAALGEAPATDAWTVIVMSAATVAAWANDLTVTVPQVIAGGGYPSLKDFMDDIGGRVTALESVLPSTGVAATASQASGIEITLPQTKEVMFFKGDSTKAFGTDGVDATALGRAPMMLPAVHDASVTAYLSGALPAPAADTVWQNTTGAAFSLGRGIHGGVVADDGYFASDGRSLYAADRSGSTTSYFPTGFERELWRIFVNDKMLRVNRVLDVQFGLALQLINATSNAQWLLVIEKGTAPEDTTPSTPATNLQNIVWDAEPILSQRLILTGNRQTHGFGTRIKRSVVTLADTITLDTMLYGVWEGNDEAAPAAANFALRARLIQFDTENALASDARGWVAYEIIGADSGSAPKATIA